MKSRTVEVLNRVKSQLSSLFMQEQQSLIDSYSKMRDALLLAESKLSKFMNSTHVAETMFMHERVHEV